MDLYYLALSLPAAIRSQLASLCYGLPNVRWVEEENFYLVLRNFGQLSDRDAALIEEQLDGLFFVKFPLTLKGIGHFNSKGNRGTLWVGIEESPQLIALKREIQTCLRNLPLPSEERSFVPHVNLGRYERLSPHRLAEYLMEHAHYQSLPFDIAKCLLLTSHQTPKHTYYKVVKQFDASLHTTGED